MTTALTAGVGVLLLTTGAAAAGNVLTVGPRDDGTAVTPTGFYVTPAGAQTALGDKPLNLALSPDGRTLLVTNDGQSTQSIQVVDAASHTVVQTIEYPNTPPPGSKVAEALFVGLAWSPDGKHAYSSAGGNEKIRVFDVADQHLTETAPIKLPTKDAAGKPANLFPAGLAISPGGNTLYVADNQSDSMSIVDVATRTVKTYAAGHNPYDVALSPDGRTAYLSNMGDTTVSVYDTSTAALRRTISVGTHPNKILVDPKSGVVYVANGDSDSVSVIDPTALAVDRTISLAPYPGAPVGSNPDGLALSPDGRTLYVANAGNNDVDVVKLYRGGLKGAAAKTAAQRPPAPQPDDVVLGNIPTGWYPSAVAVSRDGRRMWVLNAKGLGAGPNDGAGHPNPYSQETAPDQYSGSMIVGTLSSLRTPTRPQLARFTKRVRENNDVAAGASVRTDGARSRVIPHRPGEPTPIKHVIYVVKENRTFDQEFGDLGKGNGDPSLNLFGDKVAPNSRSLQRRFVTFDNFYADAEISAQGWNWVTGANSNPYVEQTWEANYSPRNHGYDYEGGNPASAPGKRLRDSYLWDRLAAKGVSFRNYGFFKFGPTLNGRAKDGSTLPGAYVDPVLAANTDPEFSGYDLTVRDSYEPGTSYDLSTGTAPRMAAWKAEFDEYVKNKNLPTVELVRLPNDHTSGTRAGRPTPNAQVADNDYALGQLVDAVSHSPYWDSTAIFVTEDDAQNGPDHVDAHRTITNVISPYSQTGKVDSTLYSTVSMLRTMELITGLQPMTQFDAFAIPMIRPFSEVPNSRRYRVVRPRQSLTELNPPTAPLAAAMEKQNFAVEDRTDEQLLNQAIWKSVRGANSRMPDPVHQGRPRGTGDEEDDD